MNVDNKVNINGEKDNLPFFTSPDNRGWLSAQLKTRHPVTDGENKLSATTFFYRPQSGKDYCDHPFGPADAATPTEFNPVEPEHGAIDVRDILEKSGTTGEGGCARIKSSVGQNDLEDLGHAYQATAGKKVSVPYNYKTANYSWTGVCGEEHCSLTTPIVGVSGDMDSAWQDDGTVGTTGATKYLGYLNSKYPFKHNNNLYGDKYLKWGRMKRADAVQWARGGSCPGGVCSDPDGPSGTTGSGTTPDMRAYAGRSDESALRPRFQHSHCKDFDYLEEDLKYDCEADGTYYDYIGTGTAEENYGYHMQHTGDLCFNFKGGSDASFIYSTEKHKYRNLCGGNAIGVRQDPVTPSFRSTITNLNDETHPVLRREDPVSNMKIRADKDGSLDIDILGESSTGVGSGTTGFGEESNYPRQFGTKTDNYIVIPASLGTTTNPASRTMNPGINVAARQWAYISDTELTVIDNNLTSEATPDLQKGETLNTYGRDINKSVLDNSDGGGASGATGGYHSKSWHDVYKPIRATSYPFNNSGDYDMDYFDPDFSYGWSGINIDLNNIHGSDGNQVGVNITTRGISDRMGYWNNRNAARRHGTTALDSKYNTGRGIGGGGRMGGDFEYSASTLDAKRVENGIPGVCFVNRIGGGTDGRDDQSWRANKGSSVSGGRSGKDVQFFDNNDTRTVTGGQVWTGRTYWGTKENEENWKTLDDRGGARGYDDAKHKNAVLPEHDGYREIGINKNRPLTGYMLVDLGDHKVPKEDAGSGPRSLGIGPMKNDISCGVAGVANGCNRLKYRREIMDAGGSWWAGTNIADYKMSAGITGEDFDGGSDTTYPGDAEGGGVYDSTTEQCFYIFSGSDIFEAGLEKTLNMGSLVNTSAQPDQNPVAARSLYTLFRDDEGGSFTPYHIGRHYDNRWLPTQNFWRTHGIPADGCDGELQAGWREAGGATDQHWGFRMDACNVGSYSGRHWTYMPVSYTHLTLPTKA